jgi:hypothetical protein
VRQRFDVWAMQPTAAERAAANFFAKLPRAACGTGFAQLCAAAMNKPTCWLLVCLLGASFGSSAAAQSSDQFLNLGTSFGSGVMRGGHGGLASAQRAPFFVDATVLGVQESWLLVGGSLRVELEDGRAVAGVARAVLRHKLGAMELRPGAALPFYFAPRTMLGPEADLGLRFPLSQGFGLVANAGVAAFMIGNDVPHGTTVVMFHLQLGVDLFL